MEKPPGQVSDAASQMSGISAISGKTQRSRAGNSVAAKNSRPKKKLANGESPSADDVSAASAGLSAQNTKLAQGRPSKPSEPRTSGQVGVQ